MVPTKTHPKWAALLQGRCEHKFSNAAVSMLLFQLKADLRANSSPVALEAAVEKMHAFFTKYQGFLRSDIDAIFN